MKTFLLEADGTIFREMDLDGPTWPETIDIPVLPDLAWGFLPAFNPADAPFTLRRRSFTRVRGLLHPDAPLVYREA